MEIGRHSKSNHDQSGSPFIIDYNDFKKKPPLASLIRLQQLINTRNRFFTIGSKILTRR